jgi:hypothetical protein
MPPTRKQCRNAVVFILKKIITLKTMPSTRTFMPYLRFSPWKIRLWTSHVQSPPHTSRCFKSRSTKSIPPHHQDPTTIVIPPIATWWPSPLAPWKENELHGINCQQSFEALPLKPTDLQALFAQWISPAGPSETRQSTQTCGNMHPTNLQTWCEKNPRPPSLFFDVDEKIPTPPDDD